MQKKAIRSIFVSDVHLGWKYANGTGFLRFLGQHRPEHLYLVGDFIDGWQLRKRWYWEPVYNQVIRRLIDLADSGTKICYTPGNHDDFLSEFIYHLGIVEIRREFVHESATGLRFLVMHGDQFDGVERHARWLSVAGAAAYDALIWVDRWVNRVRRRFGYRHCAISAAIKRRVKRAVMFVSDFEKSVADYVLARNCHGVVCGHIHVPAISRASGVIYCNAGDWVEHCSALVEYEDGSFAITHLHPESPAPHERHSVVHPAGQIASCADGAERVPPLPCVA
jgi:UDP-2,3-diacylglucosamine pyrophosphatase LpxH